MAAFVLPPGAAVPEPLASSPQLRFVSIGFLVSPLRDRDRPVVPATVIATDNVAEAWECFLTWVKEYGLAPESEGAKLLDAMRNGVQKTNSEVV